MSTHDRAHVPGNDVDGQWSADPNQQEDEEDVHIQQYFHSDLGLGFSFDQNLTYYSCGCCIGSPYSCCGQNDNASSLSGKEVY